MALQQGTLSPMRRVPPRSRARSTSAGRRRRAYAGPEVKDAETIARDAASPAGSPRRRCRRSAGTSPRRHDRRARPDRARVPASTTARTRRTLGYRGFPKSLCTSLNEVICHGIPDSTVLQDGDIVNIDITAYIDGVHGDTNATFLVGDVDEESRLLVERTAEATRCAASRRSHPGRSAQRRSAG